MHEVFLTRLAHHPVLKTDNNFRVFLEYKEDVRFYFTQYFLRSIMLRLYMNFRKKKEDLQFSLKI